MATATVLLDTTQPRDCCVCLESFSQTTLPKILPCSHNVCVKCLHDLARDRDHKLLCPLCRIEVKPPKNDVYNLPSNLTLLQSLDSQLSKVCQNCGREQMTSSCSYCYAHTASCVCRGNKKEHSHVNHIRIAEINEHLTQTMKSACTFQHDLDKHFAKEGLAKNENLNQINEKFEIFLNTLNKRRAVMLDEVTQTFYLMKNQYDNIKRKLKFQIDAMNELMMKVAFNTTQYVTGQTMEDLDAEGANITSNLKLIIQKSGIGFCKVDIEIKIENIKKRLDNLGTMATRIDRWVTCAPLPAPPPNREHPEQQSVPVDYTKKGKLLKKVKTWHIDKLRHEFGYVNGIAVGTNRCEVFITDYLSHRVHVFTLSVEYKRSFGGPGTSPGHFSHPCGLCINSEGIVIVTDFQNNRCQMLTAGGRFISEFGHCRSGEGKLDGPTCVTVDDTDNIYVTSSKSCRIMVYRKDGTYIRAFGTEGSQTGQFQWPNSIKWSRGMCIVRDKENGVQLWSDCGKFIRAIGSGNDRTALKDPQCVTADQQGNMLVLDTGAKAVNVYSMEAKFETSFSVADFKGHIGFLSCTPEGTVVVADSSAKSILIY